MLVPFLLFGTVIYFGVRAVMERESHGDDGLVHFPVPQVPTPQEPTAPPSAPQANGVELDTSPTGWPADGPSYMDCETFMSSLSPEELRKLVQNAGSMSDAQWTVAKAKMESMGQGMMAGCLDSTRKYMKTIKL